MPNPANLGIECTQDSDCGPAMTCITEDDTRMDGDGIAGGYCTIGCSAGLECDALLAGSVCVATSTGNYCYRGCQPSAASSFDPNKCHGRPNLACAPFADGADFACAPSCVSDADCGSRFCDIGSGFCTDTRPTGLLSGTPCNPNDTPDPCAGVCLQTGGDNEGTCLGICTFGTAGTLGGCGSPATGSQYAACLALANNSMGWGDLGICVGLCNCDEQCMNGTVCEAIASGLLSGPVGYPGACFNPTIGSTLGTCPTCQDGGNEHPDCNTCQNVEQGPGGCCASQANACNGNPACVTIANCAAGCGEVACVTQCIDANPAGSSAYLALLSCAFGAPGPEVGACGAICR